MRDPCVQADMPPNLPRRIHGAADMVVNFSGVVKKMAAELQMLADELYGTEPPMPCPPNTTAVLAGKNSAPPCAMDNLSNRLSDHQGAMDDLSRAIGRIKGH